MTAIIKIIATVLVLASSTVSGQTTPTIEQPSPKSAERLKQQMELLLVETRWEEGVEKMAALLAEGNLSRPERSIGRKYLGIFYILLEKEAKAVEVFKDIVRDDVGFDMDDLARGGEEPLIEAVRSFGQAVIEVRKEDLQRREARLLKTSRSVASLRSTLLPGWGQRYLGYRNRSYIMLALTGSAIAYAVVSDQSFRDARDTYRQAEPGADFNAIYTDYNDKANRADLALGLVGAAWVLNIIDAALQGPNVHPSDAPPDKPISLVPQRDGVAVVLHKRF